MSELPINPTLSKMLFNSGEFECVQEMAIIVAMLQVSMNFRVSVLGVKSLGGHFACLYRGFKFYEVKNFFFVITYCSKRKWKYFYTFNHFYSEKSSKRAKWHKSTTMTPNLPE